MSDPHAWNNWDNYRTIHESYMEQIPFVVEDHLTWDIIGDPSFPDEILLVGYIICKQGVYVHVQKRLETRLVGHGQLQVRGLRYAYNAFVPGQYNILRYDNGHADALEFHRHEFDVKTGKEKLPTQILTGSKMPTLAQFLHEVASIVDNGWRKWYKKSRVRKQSRLEVRRPTEHCLRFAAVLFLFVLLAPLYVRK